MGIRIRSVSHAYGNIGVLCDIASFCPAFSSVYQNISLIVVNLDRCDLRGAVAHHCGEGRKVLVLEKLLYLRGHLL